MKNINPISGNLKSTIFWCVILLVFSQVVFAQPYPGSVILKDNTVLSGFVMPDHDEGIFFGTAESDVSRAIAPADIQSLTMDINGTAANYIYMEAALPFSKNDTSKLRLMKIVKQGSVGLYEYQVNSAISVAMNGECEVLYIKRDSEAQPEMLCYVIHSMMSGISYRRSKFKEFAAGYFKDCPALVSKINKNEFKVRHYLDIVDFYNAQCK
jgi:hypothetical protein